LSAANRRLLDMHVAEDYHDLYDYSVSDYTFWLDLWDFLGIISSVPPNPAQVRRMILLIKRLLRLSGSRS